jgi:hypothetical protein
LGWRRRKRNRGEEGGREAGFPSSPPQVILVFFLKKKNVEENMWSASCNGSDRLHIISLVVVLLAICNNKLG